MDHVFIQLLWKYRSRVYQPLCNPKAQHQMWGKKTFCNQMRWAKYWLKEFQKHVTKQLQTTTLRSESTHRNAINMCNILKFNKRSKLTWDCEIEASRLENGALPHQWCSQYWNALSGNEVHLPWAERAAGAASPEMSMMTEYRKKYRKEMH